MLGANMKFTYLIVVLWEFTDIWLALWSCEGSERT